MSFRGKQKNLGNLKQKLLNQNFFRQHLKSIWLLNFFLKELIKLTFLERKVVDFTKKIGQLETFKSKNASI